MKKAQTSKAFIFLWILSLIGCFSVIDWASKHLILKSYQSSITRFWGAPLFTKSWGGFVFAIRPTFNEGAALGLFSSHKTFLLILRIIIVIALTGHLFYHYDRLNSIVKFSFIFIIAGALGNIMDLAFYGRVIDFISLGFRNIFFPTFNFADFLISLGAACFVWNLYYKNEHPILF